jgi:hypothetical protein
MKWGKRLLGLVTQNIGWKLLSLAIALVVWGVVANEPELSTFATVSVEYRNLPDDLEISSDPVSTVKLELRGPSGELRGVGDGGAAGRSDVPYRRRQRQTGARRTPGAGHSGGSAVSL